MASPRRRAPREGAAARGTLLASPASRTRQTGATDGDHIGTGSLVRWTGSPTQISNSCFQQVPTVASTQICIEAIQIRSLLHDSIPPTHPGCPPIHTSIDEEICVEVQWTDLVAGHPHMHESGEVSVSLIRELRKVGD
jgi:hypothetical protein